MEKIPTRKQSHFSQQSASSAHIHEQIMLDLISEFLKNHSLAKTLQIFQNQRKEKSLDCVMKQEEQLIMKEEVLSREKDGFRMMNNVEVESGEQKCQQEEGEKKVDLQEQVKKESELEELRVVGEVKKEEQQRETSKMTQTKIKHLLNSNKPIKQILQAFQNPVFIKQQSSSFSQIPKNPCKLLQIFQTSSNRPPKRIKFPISLKSTVLLNTSIRQILMGSGKLCFVINDNNAVELVDIDHYKAISRWSKHGMNCITSACCIGENGLLVGFEDGSLLKLLASKQVQVEYEIRELHKETITSICCDSKKTLAMSTQNKLKIISADDRSDRKTITIQNLTIMFELNNLQFPNTLVGIDRSQKKVILFDIAHELCTTIFTTPQLISQIYPYKQSILIGIQQQSPCIYEFNLKTFQLILRIQLKTIRKREINFILLNSSDTLVAVLGTKKIYYFNTKTWKLFHKIASMENRKYRGINATKDDKIVVIADEKTLEIYDCDEDA